MKKSNRENSVVHRYYFSSSSLLSLNFFFFLSLSSLPCLLAAFLPCFSVSWTHIFILCCCSPHVAYHFYSVRYICCFYMYTLVCILYIMTIRLVAFVVLFCFMERKMCCLCEVSWVVADCEWTFYYYNLIIYNHICTSLVDQLFKCSFFLQQRETRDSYLRR